MSSLPNLNYFSNSNSNTLSIVLNGADYLMNSPFMTKLFDEEKEKGHSIISFNFPFQERGEDHSSGEELLEERETLKNIIEKYRGEHVDRIRLVAKSLGSIVAIKYLYSLSKKEQSKYSLIILGAPLRFMTKVNIETPVTVIQGSEDKNGGIEEVKKFFNNLDQSKIKYFEIKGADHSFRDPQTKKPDYEDDLIELLKSRIA